MYKVSVLVLSFFSIIQIGYSQLIIECNDEMFACKDSLNFIWNRTDSVGCDSFREWTFTRNWECQIDSSYFDWCKPNMPTCFRDATTCPLIEITGQSNGVRLFPHIENVFSQMDYGCNEKQATILLTAVNGTSIERHLPDGDLWDQNITALDSVMCYLYDECGCERIAYYNILYGHEHNSINNPSTDISLDSFGYNLQYLYDVKSQLLGAEYAMMVNEVHWNIPIEIQIAQMFF